MNDYADHNVTCGECEECESIWTAQGYKGTCQALRDAIHDELGINVETLIFDPDQNAGACESFDPTTECLARIEEDAKPLAEQYGVTPGVDFPATLGR